jgi:hypothetical protein
MPYARIAITLPKHLVAAADRRARELDRSRSRVIAEALRAYLTAPAAPPAPPATPSQVREAVRPAYGSDAVGSARRAQLERDLARTPAERLRIAEEATRTARALRPARGCRHQIIGFDSYQDFYEWKKSQLA